MDDDADDDDVDGTGAPLPPDDRLWRHPSELSSWPTATSPAPAGRGAPWPVALVAGLAGAALCGGVLAVTGSLADPGTQRVVEKVALTPVVSSPLVGDEQGVATVVEQTAPSVAQLLIHTDASSIRASAVVWRDDGLLLTSAHHIVGASEISVVLHDGRRLSGTLVGADLPTDVAVVSVDANDLVVAVLGSSSGLDVGSPTVAVGSPAGAGEPSMNTGVVSALQRRLDVDGRSLHGLIQTDAPTEPAWSGGPLIDAAGAVIGITTNMAGTSTMFGYATPIDLVRRVADELASAGKATHGWLGIEGADLSDESAAAMRVPGGVVVRRVTEGSPAAQGGLVTDDVITSVADRDVLSSSELVVAMRDHKPGAVVVVGYWRDGGHHRATVTVAEHP